MTLPINYINCDSAVIKEYTSPVLQIDGLERFNNQDVVILADGRVDSPKADGTLKTVTDGKVISDIYASKFIVGYQIKSLFTTVPVDPGDATVQPKQKRIIEATFRFYETAGKITVTYPSTKNGKETKSITELFGGVKRFLSADTQNLNGQLTLFIDDPTPCSVLGYYPALEVYSD